MLTALPRTAFAVVTAENGVGSWTLQIREGVEPATLLPIGMRLRAQLLDDTTRSHVLQLVAQADPELAGEAIAGDLESLAPEPILEQLPAQPEVSDPPVAEAVTLETGKGPLVLPFGAVMIEGRPGIAETSMSTANELPSSWPSIPGWSTVRSTKRSGRDAATRTT